jgi:outer membrane lipoprotein-sorting protein
MATGREKKSYGKIDYKYPGHIRLEITSPEPKTFVVNSQKSWLYQPAFIASEEGQVTIQKSSNLPLTKLLDSFQKGLENSTFYTHKYVGNDLILSFKPEHQKAFTLKEVILHGNKPAKEIQKFQDFEKLSLVYADGQKVNLRFLELKENVSFAKNHFEFVIPKNTKVLNN